MNIVQKDDLIYDFRCLKFLIVYNHFWQRHIFRNVLVGQSTTSTVTMTLTFLV